jgi:hypothetical protein
MVLCDTNTRRDGRRGLLAALQARRRTKIEAINPLESHFIGFENVSYHREHPCRLVLDLVFRRRHAPSRAVVNRVGIVVIWRCFLIFFGILWLSVLFSAVSR